MRELPILFKPEMHRAIREGRKTETRRIVKIPKWAEPGTVEEDNDCKGGLMAIYDKTGCFSAIKPRYQVGDRLWVKEAVCTYTYRVWSADGCSEEPRVIYKLDGSILVNGHKWSSPLHMPKWAARTWLEVTGVRAERLQEITEEDSYAEGIEIPVTTKGCPPGKCSPLLCISRRVEGHPAWDREPSAKEIVTSYYALKWEEIHGKGSWKANPWVWVYQFKLLEGKL